MLENTDKSLPDKGFSHISVSTIVSNIHIFLGMLLHVNCTSICHDFGHTPRWEECMCLAYREQLIGQTRPPQFHRLLLKRDANMTPATNPPMCPPHAIPPPVCGSTLATVPENTCIKNHHPRKKTAGSSTNHGNMKMGINVRILARRNIT